MLYRDKAGKVHCLSDICIHRGGSLSNGWTTDRGCVACPYHGWEFDPEGKVAFIPSRGEGGDVLIGEVSTVNDDETDNIFREPIGRFADIEEDVDPAHLLVSDYARWLA